MPLLKYTKNETSEKHIKKRLKWITKCTNYRRLTSVAGLDCASADGSFGGEGVRSAKPRLYKPA